ncbi:hypothetical protein D3C80_786530 [compost metagenome]
MPIAPKTSDGHSRRSDTAPWSRLPMMVTATGRKPMMMEVKATPLSLTAVDMKT